MNFASLVDAFYAVCHGRDEPDEVAMAEPGFSEYRKFLEYPHPEDLRFLGAKVVLDPKLSMGVIDIRNTKHPGDPKYNARLENVSEPKMEETK